MVFVVSIILALTLEATFNVRFASNLTNIKEIKGFSDVSPQTKLLDLTKGQT